LITSTRKPVNPIQLQLRVFALRGLLCLVLCPAVLASAQVGTASIAGIVEDTTMARIPNAGLKLINVMTGTENDSASSNNGVFLLPGVIPGNYTLQIEREGFATAQVTGIALNVGDTKGLLIRMTVGPVTDTVHIDASGITIDTVDAAASTVVDRNFVTNIPLNGRSFQDLISMTPGVLTENPQSADGRASAHGGLGMNGQKATNNSFLVDGVSGNFGSASLAGSRKTPSAGDQLGLTALDSTHSLASVDALEEFRVLGTTSTAEYGGAPGGQFTLLTRSGTNQVHGSLFNYRRFSQADSAEWFTGFWDAVDHNGTWQTTPYHQNDIGGTLGFPVPFPKTKNGIDRSFLFLAFEEVHVEQPTAYQIQYAPSDGLLKTAPAALHGILADFSEDFYVNQAPPESLTPLVSSLSYFSMPGSIRATGIRLDHTFSPKVATFLRYSGSPSDSQSLNLSSLTDSHVYTQTATLGIMAQLSPISSNDFRLGYASSSSRKGTSIDGNYGGYPGSNGFVPTNLLTDFGVPTGDSWTRGEAYIHIPGIGESSIDVDQASSSLYQWNARDTFNYRIGKHALRAGFEDRYIVSTVTSAPLSVEADFFDTDSLLNNSASDLTISKNVPATPVFNETSVFLQDEWRVSKTFTVSSGLRWDLFPAPHGRNGVDAYTVQGSLASPGSLQIAPRGTSLSNTDWWNIAPRIGVAWAIDDRPGRELVLRAGSGVYFNSGNEAISGAFSALGFSATEHFENVPVPVTQAMLDFSPEPAAPYTNSIVYAFPRHLASPYSLQWNVAIEKALGKEQTFTVSWIGAEGQRLLQERRTDIRKLNPMFGEVVSFPDGITSNYESLQAKFQRSISPGIQVLSSYVWAHALDYGSTDPAFPLQRGNSDRDVRHSIQAALSWQQHQGSPTWLPRFGAAGLVNRAFFTGWGVDGRVTARTGYPVTLHGNLLSDPATGERYFSGVDSVPNRPLYLYGNQYPGGRIFNGGPDAGSPAFVLPEGTNAGNAARNQLRDFGTFQVNIGLRREFPIYNRLNLQVRAESFNVFSHPSFGYIDASLTDALFGQATLMLNQSFGSGGSMYEPGGPRSLQFSAKLRF